MTRQSKPKPDLFILLSHLGYVKEIELTRTIRGINIIQDGQTGLNLPYSPGTKDIHTRIVSDV